MYYELQAALILSPGNKAKTMRGVVTWIVCEYQGEFDEKLKEQVLTNQLVAIKDGRIAHEEHHYLYSDFGKDLKEHGLDAKELIWEPIR